jgi:large subunit ribosomal protein L3
MGSQADAAGAAGGNPGIGSGTGPANPDLSGLGLLGRKLGMMRIFSDDGETIPVTVIDVSDNRISQVKTAESDGYTSVQLVHGTRRASRVTKAQAGHLAKAGVQGGTSMSEFRVTAEKAGELKAGAVIGADLFVVGQYIDVQGTSQGKGFTGTIKRHNFRSNRASHGNSRSHNVPGSIGMAQDPGRVFPGKKMSGHMGDVTRTVQNLIVARVDTERGLLLVRGAVPGSTGGDVVVTPAVKRRLNPVKAAPVAKADAKADAKAAGKPAGKPAGKK